MGIDAINDDCNAFLFQGVKRDFPIFRASEIFENYMMFAIIFDNFTSR